MSAMSPIAPELMRWGEMTRCARSCHRALSAHSRNLLALVARRDPRSSAPSSSRRTSRRRIDVSHSEPTPRGHRRRTMTMAILGSALFFVVAPSVLAGLIPWWMTRWEFLPPFFDLQATRAVGFLLIVAGVPGLVDSFARFALQGLGTPAPIAPTQNLVVTGLYRYVRNPIYIAVVAVILGQGILFGDWRLLIYGGLMWLAFHAFVLAYEEPVLAESFGAQYEDFRANVPRWIPRLTPWRAA